jgi:hypothetical protein
MVISGPIATFGTKGGRHNSRDSAYLVAKELAHNLDCNEE